MNKDDKLFYDEAELIRDGDVEAFMSQETLLKKFRNTFNNADGIDVFEFIINELCNAFDTDITSERLAYKKEVGLKLWQLAYKADVEICIALMRRWALKYQNYKVGQLNKMKGDQDG